MLTQIKWLLSLPYVKMVIAILLVGIVAVYTKDRYDQRENANNIAKLNEQFTQQLIHRTDSCYAAGAKQLADCNAENTKFIKQLLFKVEKAQKRSEEVYSKNNKIINDNKNLISQP